MDSIKDSLIDEKNAPVSGARCRGCGTRPWRNPDAEWFLIHCAAYCPDCAFDVFAEHYLFTLRLLDQLDCADPVRQRDIHATLEQLTNDFPDWVERITTRGIVVG